MDEPEMGVGGFHQHSTISKAKGSWSAQNTNPCLHVLNTLLREHCSRMSSAVYPLLTLANVSVSPLSTPIVRKSNPKWWSWRKSSTDYFVISVIRAKHPMVGSPSPTYFLINRAISVSLLTVSTKGFAPVRKILWARGWKRCITFRSLSISDIGDMRNRCLP